MLSTCFQNISDWYENINGGDFELLLDKTGKKKQLKYKYNSLKGKVNGYRFAEGLFKTYKTSSFFISRFLYNVSFQRIFFLFIILVYSVVYRLRRLIRTSFFGDINARLHKKLRTNFVTFSFFFNSKIKRNNKRSFNNILKFFKEEHFILKAI